MSLPVDFRSMSVDFRSMSVDFWSHSVDFRSVIAPRVESMAIGVTINHRVRYELRISRLRSKSPLFGDSKPGKTPEKPVLERPEL